MMSELLTYNFFYDNIYTELSFQKLKPIEFNSFNHDNYKKDSFKVSKKVDSKYGKKRRNYSDYC